MQNDGLSLDPLTVSDHDLRSAKFCLFRRDSNLRVDDIQLDTYHESHMEAQ